MQRVVLFKGDFNHNVVNNFVDEIAKVLIEKQFEVVIIPLTNDEKMMKSILSAFEKKVYFVLGFNGIGSDLRFKEQSFYDIFNTLFIYWLVDHPALHFERIEEPIQNSIIICIDETHCDYIDKYYPQKLTAFIEHGTALEEIQQVKKYDIVFAGSIENLDEIEKQMSPLLQYFPTLLEDIVSYTDESNFNLDTFKEDYLKANTLLEEIFKQNRVNIFAFMKLIDRYFRAYKRQQLLKNILNTGVTVSYFGSLPENNSLHQYSNLNLEGTVDYTLLTKIFCETKVVVNIMPNFVQGGHERIFNAMACGAVLLTDVNSYIREHFNSNVIEMNMNEIDCEKLNEILTDDEAREAMVAENSRLIKNHTWDKRVESLLQVVAYIN